MTLQSPEIDIARKADQAFQKIGDIHEKEKDFLSYIKGLPTDLMQNGLVQTFVFIKQKNDDKYKKVYTAFQDYMKELSGQQADFDLIRFFLSKDFTLDEYIFYQKKIIDFAIWFKRIGLALYDKTQ